jgi:nucleoside 2-deoxyribosyltransferase
MKCFVITPYDKLHLDLYEKFLKPEAEKVGYITELGKDWEGSSFLLEDLWKSIQNADVLIAVLDKNDGNVFYELGLAHAIGKPVVLVANKLAPNPSNLGGIRVITYDTETELLWHTILTERVVNILCALKDEPHRCIPECFRKRNSGQ